MSVLTSGRWPLGRTAGPCRRGFLSDTTPPPAPGIHQRVHIPRPEVQGLKSSRGWGTPCKCLFPLVAAYFSGLISVSPHPSVSASSLCLLPLLLPIPGITLSALECPLSALECRLLLPSSVPAVGVGVNLTFLPLLSPVCPPPPPPTYLWDVSQPLECLVTNPGLLKCSSRVPQ